MRYNGSVRAAEQWLRKSSVNRLSRRKNENQCTAKRSQFATRVRAYPRVIAARVLFNRGVVKIFSSRTSACLIKKSFNLLVMHDHRGNDNNLLY